MGTKGGGRSRSKPPEGRGEFRGSPSMGVAVVSGATFTNKSVTYYEVEGIAIVEGDIALGTVEDVAEATARGREAVSGDPTIAFGVGITGSSFRWPNCRIPHEIDPALPDQQRVTDAIAHWEARTSFRFPVRTDEPNWVRFTDAGGCWSMVGMQGGQQTISLGPGCSMGNAIHEIGHTIGLWHEQSREDRDLFVAIHWENIQSGMAAQFNQHISDGDDLGAYDYGSIMHYPRTAFSRNGQDTIVPTDPNAQIGQRTGLSAGDVAAVQAMYPSCRVVKRPDTPFKKIRDDGFGSFKKIRDDDLVVKAIRDPKLPRDVGPIKAARDQIAVRPEIPVIQPGGGLRPFTMSTPHHAPGAEALEGGAVGDPSGYLAALLGQMLELEAALAEVRATAARAQADAAQLEAAGDALAAVYADALAAGGGEA